MRIPNACLRVNDAPPNMQIARPRHAHLCSTAPFSQSLLWSSRQQLTTQRSSRQFISRSALTHLPQVGMRMTVVHGSIVSCRGPAMLLCGGTPPVSGTADAFLFHIAARRAKNVAKATPARAPMRIPAMAPPDIWSRDLKTRKLMKSETRDECCDCLSLSVLALPLGNAKTARSD